MFWICTAALLSILFLVLGRRPDNKEALSRLDRFQNEGYRKAEGPEACKRKQIIRLFELVFKASPEPVKILAEKDLGRYVPYIDCSVEMFAGFRICAAVFFPTALVIITGFSAPGLALSFPFGFFGTLIPKIVASRQRRSFIRDVNLALPHATDILYSLVLGGKNLDQAFRGAVEVCEEPLKSTLVEALSEIELGASKEESFERLTSKYQVPGLTSLLRSIVEAEKRGLELSETLRVQSRELRIKHRDSLRVTAAKAPLKILIPLVFLILPSAIILALGPTILSTFSKLF